MFETLKKRCPVPIEVMFPLYKGFIFRMSYLVISKYYIDSPVLFEYTNECNDKIMTQI